MEAFKHSFFEDTNLPANTKPFMVYFVQRGDVAEAVVTNRDGEVKMLGNTSLIQSIVASMMPRTYAGTSISALTIGAGPLTLECESGLAYVVDQRVRLLHDSSNYMQGIITAYGGTTMEVTIDFKIGAGTYNSWVLSTAQDTLVPDGGSTGKVLGKLSPGSYDVGWITPGSLTQVVIAADANIVAAANTRIVIPHGVMTADRTIDISALATDSDVLEIFNHERTYSIKFSGAPTIYTYGNEVFDVAEALRVAPFKIIRLNSELRQNT